MLWCTDNESSYNLSAEDILKNFSVLYVEDDKNAQMHIQELLADEVKILYQAFDGEEGLKIYHEKNPDIIITDIRMPKLDGIGMMKQIKSKNRCKPIIVTTAFDDKETLLETININIHSFIPKPLNIDLLFSNLYDIAINLQNKIDAEKARRNEVENLYYKAHYDLLTNIPNRTLFHMKLDQAINRAQRNNSIVTLFFIDIDNFKQINDTHGHHVGDMVLKKIVQNIEETIRLEDTFSRISGDEFSLILEDISDKKSIETIASKIAHACQRSCQYENITIKTSCSIGIAQFPQDALTKEDLIRKADQAMYQVKRTQKGTYKFSS
ncbi:MAG: GGDEF domain-containing response regulator [Epsilonproteobacteria bacterium]|nr:GGDEF domain-containing response regulator [Campylobacterota bacterium]